MFQYFAIYSVVIDQLDFKCLYIVTSVCRGGVEFERMNNEDTTMETAKEDEQRPQNYQKEIKSIAVGIKTALRILQKESLEDYF